MRPEYCALMHLATPGSAGGRRVRDEHVTDARDELVRASKTMVR